MTRALVVSDNHGDRTILEKIVEQWADRVDVLIHCGDSEIPAADPLMQQFVCVAGNNDIRLGYQADQNIMVAGQRFLVTHGHHYRVNFSMTPIMLKGAEEGADVICFGHTHQLFAATDRDMLLLNPGSISLPRGQYAKIGGTFAVIEATPDQFVVDFYNRRLQVQPRLHREFIREVR